MTEEKVYFKTPKGNTLCGVLSRPNKKHDSVVVICHGFRSSKDGKSSPQLQKILNGRNIATFRFDFFGHGESDGKFEDITISEAVEDVLSAIRFVKGTGYSKIGLIGTSFGGISSIVAASRSKDLRVLVLRAPVSNYQEKETLKRGNSGIERWKETGYVEYDDNGRKFKLKYAFFEDFENNNGYEAGKNIKIPTLIIHGDKDDVVPIEQSIRLSKIISNCKLEIIRGADHNFTDENDFIRTLESTANFITTKL
ncbi:MAG: alpha/beta fold hydrolase [Candidatus Aenigmarchaeota archaeon]|nr:alpha/beta fold hydrolase [Candidatus Aenigmarchaeota archaeon]